VSAVRVHGKVTRVAWKGGEENLRKHFEMHQLMAPHVTPKQEATIPLD
jgi:hypothetical protein